MVEVKKEFIELKKNWLQIREKLPLKEWIDTKVSELEYHIATKHPDKKFGEFARMQKINELLNILKICVQRPDEIDYKFFAAFASPGERMLFFVTIAPSLDDKSYWERLRENYVLMDYTPVPTEVIKGLFASERSGREAMMTEEERTYLNNLPDIFTIYRGCNEVEIESGQYGVSWTMDKKIAEFYRDRKEMLEECSSTVLKKEVEKRDVIAYFSCRKEEEIIYLG